jgi:hypothetical protein
MKNAGGLTSNLEQQWSGIFQQGWRDLSQTRPGALQ